MMFLCSDQTPPYPFCQMQANVLTGVCVCCRPYGKTVDHASYWAEFQSIMLAAGGRPHWAKDHGLEADTLRAMFPRWDRFVEIRNKLDPDRMFSNEYLDRVLGQ